MQTEAQENKIQEKDSEVLRLLNQIATDMIRKSDVDRLVEEAVAKATAALKASGRRGCRQGYCSIKSRLRGAHESNGSRV